MHLAVGGYTIRQRAGHLQCNTGILPVIPGTDRMAAAGTFRRLPRCIAPRRMLA